MQAEGIERRVPGLDGLRGTATIMVVVSHYFGEIPHGLRATMFGWIGVDIFFVLSGYLIGKLILERCRHENFFEVFYVRRCARIIPAYLVALSVIAGLLYLIQAPWTDADASFPLWSYATFTQSFFMVANNSIGTHWLSPTWTLALEEHFYILIPATIVFMPRRLLAPTLGAVALLAVCLRLAVYQFGFASPMFVLALLPGRADILVCGLMAAIAINSNAQYLRRHIFALRVAPLAALIFVLVIRTASNTLFEILGPLAIGAGSACFILCIVLDAPEARRFNSKILRFFGDNSYCIYLTHLPVLGLMHGLILHARPDLATFAQWLATLGTLPLCVLVGWGMTKLVEEPCMRYGRKWRWSSEKRLVLEPAIAH